jgi:PAS domain S-box-containing protein
VLTTIFTRRKKSSLSEHLERIVHANLKVASDFEELDNLDNPEGGVELLVLDLDQWKQSDLLSLDHKALKRFPVKLGHSTQSSDWEALKQHLSLDMVFDLQAITESGLAGWMKLAEERFRVQEAASPVDKTMKLMIELNQRFTQGEDDYLDQALQCLLEVLRSAYGYIYLYNEAKKEFTLNTWSKGVMPECAVDHPQTCYELDKTGFWGEAVRQRKSLIMNDFGAEHPKKKGYPKGHVPIKRFLTAPIFHQGEIVAVVGAANKTAPYNQTDLDQVHVFMQSVWQTVLQRRNELENARLLNAIKKTPVSIVITDKEGNIEYTNPYFTERTGYTPEEVYGKNPRILKSGFQNKTFYEELWRTIAQGRTWSGELQNRAKNGTLFWELATITPLMNQAGVERFIAVKKDITAEVKQREAIALKERLLSSSESLAQTGGWEYDVVKDRMYWTSNLYNIYGFDHSDTNFDHIAESIKCYPKRAQQQITSAFETCLEQGKPYDLTLPFTDANGKKKWIRSRTNAIKDASGSVVKVVGSVKDVTQYVALSKEKEAHLQTIQEQERFLNSIVHSSNAGIGVIDLSGKFTFGNATLLEQLKTNSNELKKLSFQDFTQAEDAAEEAELIQAITTGKRDNYRKEKRITCRDGSTLWADVHVSPIRDKLGQVTALIGVLVDITAKKQQELALKESEHRYRSLNENLATILWTSDHVGNVNYINPYGVKYFHTYAEKVLEKGWLSIVHPEDATDAMQKWAEAIERGEDYVNQFRVQTDKGYRWIQTSASPERSTTGDTIGWIGLTVDITEQKEAQDELKERERRFKAVINAFQDIVFTLDIEGKHTELFGEWVEEYGMRKEDFIGKTTREVLGDELADLQEAALSRTLKGERSEFEWHIEEEGEKRYFLTYLTPIQSDKKEIQSILGVGREITQAKRYQKSLEDHTTQLAALAEFSSALLQMETAQDIYDYVAVFLHQMVDRKGYVIVSKLLEDGEAFEIKSIEGIGKQLNKVLKLIGKHPLHMKGRIKAPVIEAMKYGGLNDLELNVDALADASFANYFKRKALSQLGIDELKSILVYDGKEPQASVSLALPKDHKSIDVNLIESLMSQAAMALSRTASIEETIRNEERLMDAQAIGQFGDWTYVMEDDRYFFSDTAKKMLKLDPDQAVTNAMLFELIHPDDRALVQAQHVKVAEGETVRFEHRLRIGEDLKWFRIISTPLLDDHQQIFEVRGVIHDITESKRAELKLIESENRFRSLIEYNNTDIIIVKDAEQRINYVSPSLQSILGYTVNELMHTMVPDLLHHEDKDAYALCFSTILTGQKSSNSLKARMRHKNGAYRWVLTTISDQREISGVDNFVENIKDIHQEEQANQSLKESHHRYELASKATKDIIYDYNVLSGIIEMSNAYTERFGYDECRFNIERWEQNIHPEDQAGILHDLETHLSQPDKTAWKVTYRMKAKNGEYHWIEERAAILRTSDGTAKQMIGALSDMTEHFEYRQSIEEQNKKLKEIAWMQSHLVRAPLANLLALVRLIQDIELEGEERVEVDKKIITAATQLDEMIRSVVKNAQRLEHDERLSNAFTNGLNGNDRTEVRLHPVAMELSPLAYCTTNKQRQIITMNRAFERLLGFEHKVAIGQTPAIFVSNEADSGNSATEMQVKESAREPYQLEIIAQKQNGNRFWSRLTGQPYLDKNGVFSGYLFSIKDISKERRSEQLLKEKSKSLARINEELKQFTYIITHDLKAPANSIGSLIELLEKELPDLTSKQSELFKRIVKNSDEVKRMLNALLEYARNGSTTEKRTTVVLRDVINDIQNSLHAMMAENSVKISVLKPDTKLDVYPTHFHRILLNLIQNGIKFRRAETPEIKIKASETDHYWQIEVEDNGIGIPADEIPHIFKMFYAKNRLKNNDSHGIGLSVVRRLVQEHEGSIRVNSELGRGTNFIFTVIKV